MLWLSFRGMGVHGQGLPKYAAYVAPLSITVCTAPRIKSQDMAA